MPDTRSAADVVVIGGGHNGLVAACYLARAGADVLVVEKEERPGGMTLSAPLIPAAPDHVVSPGAYENVYLRAGGVVEDLGLARHGYREVDSAGWVWLRSDGASLLFQRDVEATARDIARFSKPDAARYRELVGVALNVLDMQAGFASADPARPPVRWMLKVMRDLAADRRLRSTIGALFTGTAVDAISSTFASGEMRGAFASIATILGSPTTEGSAIALLGTSALHHKGAARPIGGMGGLVAALASCLRHHGGAIRCGERADAVECVAGRARAVRLADGTTLRARHGIVAAIPPQRLPELLGDSLPHAVAERLRRAPANAAGVATLTVNMALGGRLELPHHQPLRDDTDLRRPALFTGSLDGVLEACSAAARGDVPSRPPWWAAIFSAMDPSQAPPGQDVVQLYTPAPVHARGGWDEARVAASERLVDEVGETLPAIRDLELGRFVESPADLSRRTGTVNGCLYHVDHVPTRMGPLRPALGAGRHRTPVSRLYLSGAGTHPSGGVSGLPGKLVAARLLAERGRQRTWVSA